MPQEQTLNSRVRVLVAKTFRAEQLYGAMRNNSLLAKGNGASTLLELANDLRAREWQRCHTDLRAALNEALSSGKTSVMVSQLVHLYEQYADLAVAEEDDLTRAVEEAKDLADRREFTTLWKVTAEMVRRRAHQQACRAIAEEIAGILQACGHTAALTRGVIVSDAVKEEEESLPPVASNVIPLARRAGR